MTLPEAAKDDSGSSEAIDPKEYAQVHKTFNENYDGQGTTAQRSAERAGWEWPKDMASESPNSEHSSPSETSKNEESETPVEPSVQEERAEAEDNTTPPPRRRHYRTRQCRICLEEVPPSFETPTEGIGAFLNPSPKVIYVSEPESGRLIRPCKCRGSQAYIHEGCLEQWRYADSGFSDRNFWHCPTCKFIYRIERMKWARMISSTVAQIVLTSFIMFAAVFLLGFIADPIINLYFDPGGTIASVATGGGLPELEDELTELDGWAMHFMKGLTSIGVLGFVKVIWAMSPITMWNFRGGLFGTGGRNGRVRAGVTGRDRTDTTFWLLVIIGVVTFLVVSEVRCQTGFKH